MPYRAPNQRAITPQNRGRFPGFDVLDQAHVWDDVTAGVVLARLARSTDLSFFTMAENSVATALCDLLLAQDDEPRVPVVALIDSRLALGETDGWHYDDLPEDGQAWRNTLAFLDDDATTAHSTPFATLLRHQQGQIVQSVQDRASSSARWHDYPAAQVWSLWTRYACTAFYSHPWAWNEIGFSGPAYPRGYKNRNGSGREPWEVRDHDGGDPVIFADRIHRARQENNDVLSTQDEEH